MHYVHHTFRLFIITHYSLLTIVQLQSMSHEKLLYDLEPCSLRLIPTWHIVTFFQFTKKEIMKIGQDNVVQSHNTCLRKCIPNNTFDYCENQGIWNRMYKRVLWVFSDFSCSQVKSSNKIWWSLVTHWLQRNLLFLHTMTLECFSSLEGL